MYSNADLSATIPDDLDPDRHRIVCQHFFGIDPEALRALRSLIAHFDAEPPDPDPAEEPLYSSERDRLEQLDHYHDWQGK